MPTDTHTNTWPQTHRQLTKKYGSPKGEKSKQVIFLGDSEKEEDPKVHQRSTNIGLLEGLVVSLSF